MVSNWPFFPNKKVSNGLLKAFCKRGTITQTMCTNTLFQIGGFNSNQLNQVSEALYIYLKQVLNRRPCYSSYKTSLNLRVYKYFSKHIQLINYANMIGIRHYTHIHARASASVLHFFRYAVHALFF